MEFSRHVTINWAGPIMEGSGTVAAGSGAFSLPVTFPRRIGEPEGVTSPEELMAAAHAACFAMALNATVGRKGGAIAKTEISCKVTADKGESGIKITTSALSVIAEGLTGIAAEDFAEVAKAAEAGCPVSNAYRGSMTVTLETTVK
ncbi:MAG: OsmC family peroxiredoxin [Acidobacteria bacterium]|jgi:lipoyl-dependent peroxiredoxin|nr:OsmC family peroxiredoxin [Acidobacteriota bacterium]